MTVKEHYDNHLAMFYSWMLGDVDELSDDFERFCAKHGISSQKKAVALDLGAGNGIQSVALQKMGFDVQAIDFSAYLLNELKQREEAVTTILDDIRNVSAYAYLRPELVVCCGDTATHLDSLEEIRRFVFDVYAILPDSGKFLVSFRDYSTELIDTDRFIPVKSDSQRVFTCFLEYFKDKIRVTDLLYEKEGKEWKRKVSSYFKVRLTEVLFTDLLNEAGFEIEFPEIKRGMVTIIALKKRL